MFVQTYVTFQNYNSDRKQLQEGGLALLYFIWEFIKNGSYLFGVYFYFYNLVVGLIAFCLYKFQ